MIDTSPGAAASPDPLGAFVHRVVPAGTTGPDPGYTLLLLHGTGANEDDLVPLASLVAPGAGALSPRGRVLENGMPRFFRRIREGVFDVPDLKARAAELAAFVVAAREAYAIGGRPLVALGFSNGANIAGGLLLAHPGAVDGAVLLRPMVPYAPESPPRLTGMPILIGAGDFDPFGGPDEVARLKETFEAGGARVTVHREAAGHNLSRGDFEAVKAWLAETFGAGKR